MIAPNIIRYLILLAEERGVSLDRALMAASLSRELVDSPALRVSYRQGRMIIAQAQELLGSVGLGLEVGSRQPITASGVLGLAMMSSATLYDAVQVGLRFQNLAGSMVRWRSQFAGDSLVVTADVPEVGSPVGRFLIEEGFANITRMAKDVAQIAQPKLIELAFDPGAELALFRAHFACPLRVNSPRNAWHMPAEVASLTLPTADRWTYLETVALLEAHTRGEIERQELVAILAAHIEDALPEVLPLAHYAGVLAMSERTLRRRLVEVDSSYSAVLDDVRKRLAAELFTAADCSPAEVSYRLGYADERSLRRSTLRWFGSTPSAYRIQGTRTGHGAATTSE